MKVKKKKVNQKGITLIALVITIIVLLILAAVSIATLTGQNGILTQANNAKTNTEIADEKEAIGLAYNGAMAKNNGTGVSYQDLNDQFALNGRTDAHADGANPITVTFDSGRTYTIDSNGNILGPEESNIIATMEIEGTRVEEPPMPSSGNFEHVEGTTVDNGYVIRDKENGNEFVWVPVDQNQTIEIDITSKEDITSITLTDPIGIKIVEETNKGTSYSNTNVEPTINGPYVLKVETATESKEVILGVHSLYAVDSMIDWMFSDECIGLSTNGQFTDMKSFLENISQQMGKEMTLGDLYIMLVEEEEKVYPYPDNYSESVKNNGGFYIGRYEASYYAGKVASKKSTNHTRASSSEQLTDGMLWNYVSHEIALEETKKMYSGISTIVPEVAWYRTVGWLKETETVSLFEIVADSSSWGNYSNDSFTNNNPATLINTGEYKQTQRNNIYDLAGNLYEWGEEEISNNLRKNSRSEVTKLQGVF